MRLFLFAFLLVHLFGCAPTSYPEPDAGCSEGQTAKNHPWGNYHWDISAEGITADQRAYKELFIRDETRNPAWDPIIKQTIFDWNQHDTPFKLTLTDHEAHIIIYQAHSSSWLGLAQIFPDDANHIQSGIVILNPDLLDPSKDYSLIAALHVTCQELGHVLGLGHFDPWGNTCMDDCSWAATRVGWLICLSDFSKSGPNYHDAEQLWLNVDHQDPEPQCWEKPAEHKYRFPKRLNK